MAGVLTISTQGVGAVSVSLPFDVWKALLFVAILSTAYMYCIQNAAQKYIEAEKIALTYLCEPIFATVFAYIILNEEITSRTVIGGTLILSAMLLAEVNVMAVYRRIRAFCTVN